ncbi:hypothetical protein D7Z54_19785 [Salibacterium salarium]|uniref:AhpC/TSA antioxidant enzyme n=1 Tax=Salibacterium salarium TaxID=284579 RepID=A0A428N041_9BACI|nr:AhpC/TSA family protein [Salibacterium salarium]RSL31682.1 hypothetical protein D7Z54_19785 [Salibacterium salarium]
MRENANIIQQQKGVKIVPIFPALVSLLSSFEETYGPYPFSLYADPEKEVFKGFGHQSMNKAKLLSKAALGVLTGQVKNLLPKDPEKKKVVKTSMQKSDVYIQGGTWLFDNNQQLKWKHIDESPEKHADISQIMNAIEHKL